MRVMQLLLLTLVAAVAAAAVLTPVKCIPDAELKNYACVALCRHMGFTRGTYDGRARACICGVVKPYDDLTDPTFTVLQEPAAGGYGK
jgi:hypothetical protein